MEDKTPDFKRLAADLQRLMREFPKDAGVTAVKFFLDAFKNQGWDGKEWQPRKNPARRALLVQSGRLRKSIKVSATGYGWVRVSTNVPYARIHNEGGVISATQNVRRHTRRRSVAVSIQRQTKAGRYRTVKGRWYAGDSTVKAHTRKVNIKIPRRQFMGPSPALGAKLRADMEARFGSITNQITLSQQ